MNICIFGAGVRGKRTGEYILQTEDVLVGFIDNNEKFYETGITLWNKKKQRKETHKVFSVSDVKKLKVDMILISNKVKEQVDSIKKQLKSEDIDAKIESLIENDDWLINVIGDTNCYNEYEDNRVSFIRDLAVYMKDMGIQGCVAECGVYMGDFSHYINKYFPERKMYLFDTFEGFDIKDIETEKSFNNINFLEGKYSDVNNQFSSDCNLVKAVKKKLPNLEMCIFKKGYFPNTVNGIEDKFAFVNLDMDLYNPMYAGLDFFYDKMSKNGVILLHDYYRSDLPGVRKAIKDFEDKRKQKLVKIPIGDGCSMAIIKI